jgi:UPF0755 protein
VHRKAKLATLLSVFAGVAALAAVLSFWHLESWSSSPLEIGDPVIYELAPGTTFARFNRDLADAGILPETVRFLVLAKLNKLETNLQTGEYEFATGITPRGILDKVVSGDVLLHQFRILEGTTARDLLRQVQSDERISHTLADVDLQGLNAALGIDWPYAEGIFFPDTYLIRRGDTDRDVLLRAYTAMRERLDSLWPTRMAVSLTQPDALILASIVEKETGQEADRAKISQVFHKRLAERMLLQTDPTIIYGLGDSFDGNLTRAHLRMESPYNTYRVRGLPPSPIALPSAASLEAALNPATTDYLYFVARGDGSTQFSRTLEEHNAAVREFQLQRSSR